MEIYFYITDSGRDEVNSFINHLPLNERLSVLAIFRKINIEGLSCVDTRQINGKIWELKTYRYNRFFYFIKEYNQIMIFYALKKQKNRLEKHDRDIIIERYKRLK